MITISVLNILENHPQKFHVLILKRNILNDLYLLILKNNLKNTFYGLKNQFFIITKFLKKITEALKIDFVSSVVHENLNKNPHLWIF